jgi:hypothetical protein
MPTGLHFSMKRKKFVYLVETLRIPKNRRKNFVYSAEKTENQPIPLK